MNLFLGLFIPEDGKPPIWEQMTDYYLHHIPTLSKKRPGRLTQWWERDVMECLPRARDEVWKKCAEIVKLDKVIGDDRVDAYLDYYRPHEFSILCDDSAYKISHSVRDFMPHFTTNFSPFTVRVRPGRRREETSMTGRATKNPSLTGQSSTSSTNSSDSSSEASESSEEEREASVETRVAPSITSSAEDSIVSFEALFPSMGQEYGLKVGDPGKQDQLLYKRYSLFGRNAIFLDSHGSVSPYGQPILPGYFPPDTSFCTAPPVVSAASRDIYQAHVEKGLGFADACLHPRAEDLALYERFVS
ncbi:hypothetical protein J437_LFUL004536 [Ladona fulva]|uniref:Uncharacterized protein n=1 Tax=Ladona fulva TaxID=123851 RepID=A0A8K0KAK7_LADFU|nr:hypothetical protein J437_LFUL004536 [Ladona fulva]